MKYSIIKILMNLMESFPSPNYLHDLILGFDDPDLRYIDKHTRDEAISKSPKWRYQYEKEHPWDKLFGIDISNVLKGRTVLDLGCFSGGRSVAWAERYNLHKIYGIDIKDAYINAARIFAEEKGINSEFILAYGESMPFGDEKFDAILSFDVFEHVMNPRSVLSECKRVLKNGGMLFVIFPSYFHPYEHHLAWVTRTPFLHYFFKAKDLIEVYNKIAEERGDEAIVYRRKNPELEPWEKGNTINGITARKFSRFMKETKWEVYHKNRLPLFKIGPLHSKSFFKFISKLLKPFCSLPLFEEVLSDRIVYILRKTS